MLRIAVTGGIACGKSLVGSFLEDGGVAVCDSDALAHETIAPGQPAHGEIIEAFGEGVLDAKGAVDRAVLGDRVFSDPEQREKLNAIVHPRVREGWRAWLREREAASRAAAVIIPLLFEVGVDLEWDAIICVTAAEATQLQRMATRGLSEADARRRLAAQLPNAEKARRSGYVIENSGTVEELRMQVNEVIERILGE